MVHAARLQEIAMPSIHLSSPRLTISKVEERLAMMQWISVGVEEVTAILSVWMTTIEQPAEEVCLYTL
jgi:hypothetical protein